MRIWQQQKPVRHASLGSTLAEVIISAAIASLSLGGIVWGYILAGKQTEWSACSAAANLMAAQRLEQTRAAKWDPLGYPPVDELVSASFTNVIAPLDVPSVGAENVWATNVTSIVLVQSDPPLKMIRVDCAWSLMGRGPFTNTVMTYRAQDH